MVNIIDNLIQEYEYARDMAISFKSDMKIIKEDSEQYSNFKDEYQYWSGEKNALKRVIKLIKEHGNDN